MHVYINICIYICTYVYVCINIYIHIYIYICLHIRMYVHIFTYVYIYIYIYICIYIYNIFIYVYMHIYIYICIYVHICIDIHEPKYFFPNVLVLIMRTNSQCRQFCVITCARVCSRHVCGWVGSVVNTRGRMHESTRVYVYVCMYRQNWCKDAKWTYFPM